MNPKAGAQFPALAIRQPRFGHKAAVIDCRIGHIEDPALWYLLIAR